MDQDEQKLTRRQNQERTAPVVTTTLVDLDHIIQEQGYQSGRLFRSSDKATYTFVHDNEVVSLHFDLNRQDLFIKGHKIIALEVHPHLPEFLARFKKALMEDNVSKKFLTAFDAAVGQLDKL